MNPATPSGRIFAKLDLAYPAFSAYSRAIWRSPDVRQLYPFYLRTMHMVVRSAVPLMQAALQQARARASEDRLCGELVDYYAHHIKEETGHDEWLLNDLRQTGADAGDFLNRPPSIRIAAMVGAQYYWLYHYHPVSLLGHICAIEAYHPPQGFAQQLSGLTGYPLKAFTAIARHEVLDVAHKRDIICLLDRIPLEPRHEKMIGLSGLHTLQSGMEVLDEILHSIDDAPIAATPDQRSQNASIIVEGSTV